jgi:hypothetical protein
MKTRLMEVMQTTDYISDDEIKKGITSNYVQDWLYILHDKDTYTAEDEKKNPAHRAGTLKKAHYHIFLRLKDSTDSKYIAAAFSVEEQYINKVKGKWVDVLLYATHRNAPDKYQYSDEEVVSNFDFITVRDKEEKKKNDNKILDAIIDKIDSGELREYNLADYVSMKDYVKYERAIKKAFDYRAQRIAERKDREMNCIYICGDSGTGKTTYARQIAEEKHMSYYVSSGSNDILDGYKGQDCLILDDLRPSCMGLSDLLKMLDNNTASSVKSRYRNKVLECKLIIITTTLDINTFFKNVFSEEEETIVQLKRRCSMYIRMTLDKMIISMYQPDIRDYIPVTEYANPVSEKFAPKARTEEECLNYIENMLGSTLVGVKNIRNLYHNRELEPIPDTTDPFHLATGDEPKAEQKTLFDYIN